MSEKQQQQIPLYDRFKKDVELFTRHIEILSLVYRKSPIGILRLSRETGLPKHKVRYSLKILENEGLIEAKSVGAVAVNPSEEFLENLHELVIRFKKEFDQLEQAIKLDMEVFKSKEKR